MKFIIVSRKIIMNRAKTLPEQTVCTLPGTHPVHALFAQYTERQKRMLEWNVTGSPMLKRLPGVGITAPFMQRGRSGKPDSGAGAPRQALRPLRTGTGKSWRFSDSWAARTGTRRFPGAAVLPGYTGIRHARTDSRKTLGGNRKIMFTAKTA